MNEKSKKASSAVRQNMAENNRRIRNFILQKGKAKRTEKPGTGKPCPFSAMAMAMAMARYASGKPLAAFSTRLVRGNAFP